MPDGTQLSGHVPPSKAIALLPRDGRREGKEGGKQEREKEGGKKKERRRDKEGGRRDRGRETGRKEGYEVLATECPIRQDVLSRLPGLAHRPRCSSLPQLLGWGAIDRHLVAASLGPLLCPN